MVADDFDAALAAAQSGDQEAFARIYRETQPVLLRFLRVRAPEAAEDVAAEAWLGALGRLPEFAGTEAAFRGWLVTIARNKLADHHRRGTRRPESLTDLLEDLDTASAPDTADLAIERDATERALRLIAQLPPEVAEMVALRVVVGLDVAQVAVIVGRSPGTVRVAVHRGLRRLATILDQQRVTPKAPSTIQERDA